MDTIKQVLMTRDNMTAHDAETLISEAKAELELLIAQGSYIEAENICQDYFGLEPDYLMELLDSLV